MEDEKVANLVDIINDTLEYVADVKRVGENMENPSHITSTISSLLNQISECAIFICQYFKNGFMSTPFVQSAGNYLRILTFQ